MRTIMKQLAATLSRQRGIHYEFGPEYEEYSAKKIAGILGETHIKPLSDLFTEEQMKCVPIDNKVGENYFGQMTDQLRAKGGQSFKAVGERLVLKSNAHNCIWGGCREHIERQRVERKEVKKIEAQ